MTENNFCAQPWIGIHAWPDGSVFPCCMYNSKVPLGNLNQNTIEEIFSNVETTKLRQELLDNQQPLGCKRCYELEESGMTTLRQSTNLNKSYIPIINHIKENKVLTTLETKSIDIRFSNICNFKCRTCGPELSHKWGAEIPLLKNQPDPGIIQIPREKFWNFYERALETVEEITFAGGEALMQEEHYATLNKLIELKKFDIKIYYTTNLSILKYKQYDLFETWKKFNNVEIYASLDDSGPRGEYLRKGTDWSKIEENRIKLLELPNVKFSITPTISLFNVWHFPDFQQDWVSRGLLDINAVRLNILTWPVRHQANILKNKDVVINKWYEHINWLRQHGLRDISQYMSVIEFLNKTHEHRDSIIEDFYKVNNRVDAIRSESLFDTFPELKDQL